MLPDAMSILARSTRAPFGKFAGLHAREQIEVLLDRAVAERAVLAGLGQRAARRRGSPPATGRRHRRCRPGSGAPPSRRAARNSPRRNRGRSPQSKPSQRTSRLDGVDVFLLFLGRVGVVEAQMAACRRTPARCRNSGRSTWRGRYADSRSAPAESGSRRRLCLPASRSAWTMSRMKSRPASAAAGSVWSLLVPVRD